MLSGSWRFIGRVLIALILFTTAFEKLQHSEMYRFDFNKSIDHIQPYLSNFNSVVSVPNVNSA